MFIVTENRVIAKLVEDNDPLNPIPEGVKRRMVTVHIPLVAFHQTIRLLMASKDVGTPKAAYLYLAHPICRICKVKLCLIIYFWWNLTNRYLR